MYRSLTASDRGALVRLASQLPKGGKHRRAILASLSAQKIMSLLTRAAKRVGYRVEDPEVDRNTVSISFRTDIDSADYGQYDDTADHLANEQLRPAFVKALKGVEGVKGHSMHEDEKGWWTYYVELK